MGGVNVCCMCRNMSMEIGGREGGLLAIYDFAGVGAGKPEDDDVALACRVVRSGT